MKVATVFMALWTEVALFRFHTARWYRMPTITTIPRARAAATICSMRALWPAFMLQPVGGERVDEAAAAALVEHRDRVQAVALVGIEIGDQLVGERLRLGRARDPHAPHREGLAVDQEAGPRPGDRDRGRRARGREVPFGQVGVDGGQLGRAERTVVDHDLRDVAVEVLDGRRSSPADRGGVLAIRDRPELAGEVEHRRAVHVERSVVPLLTAIVLE